MPNQYRLYRANTVLTHRALARNRAERQAGERRHGHLAAELRSLRSAEISRIYRPCEFSWLQLKGWLLHTGYRLGLPRKVSVVSGFAGVLVGCSAGYLTAGFLAPMVAVIGTGRIIAGVSAAGFCGFVTRKCAQWCLPKICSYCKFASIGFVGRLLARNPYFQEFHKEQSQEIQRLFYRNLYVPENVTEAQKYLHVEMFQLWLAEYLHDLFEKFPGLSTMGGREQYKFIHSCMNKDMEEYLEQAKSQTPKATLYSALLNIAANSLNQAYKPETVLAILVKAVGQVTKNDLHAFSQYQWLRWTTPALYEEGLTGALFNKLIYARREKLPKEQRWKGFEMHPFVISTLHKSISDYLTMKLNSMSQGDDVDNNACLASTAVRNTSSYSGAKKKRKQKKQALKPELPKAQTASTSSRETTLDSFELDAHICEAIIQHADCPERKQPIRKCLERIQNYKHWEDMRLVSSRGNGWLAKDEGEGTSMPIYHMSAGGKVGGDLRNATLLFTRSGNKVEPVAIAAHTVRSTSEYRIIQPLGDWQIPQKTVDLREAFVATKALQPAHLPA